MQDKKTGMYYNGVHTIITLDGDRCNGSINKDLYSYNPGSMILADLILYDITGEDIYYADAKFAAKASYEGFINIDKGVKYYTGYPWFGAILMEAFEALSHYDKDYTHEYIKVFRTSLNYAYENYRDKDGMLPGNPAAGFQEYDTNDRQLLTQAAYAEISALLQLAE
jgi:hypothetical protein